MYLQIKDLRGDALMPVIGSAPQLQPARLDGPKDFPAWISI
jgi:hypothetical protein